MHFACTLLTVRCRPLMPTPIMSVPRPSLYPPSTQVLRLLGEVRWMCAAAMYYLVHLQRPGVRMEARAIAKEKAEGEADVTTDSACCSASGVFVFTLCVFGCCTSSCHLVPMHVFLPLHTVSGTKGAVVVLVVADMTLQVMPFFHWLAAAILCTISTNPPPDCV